MNGINNTRPAIMYSRVLTTRGSIGGGGGGVFTTRECVPVCVCAIHRPTHNYQCLAGRMLAVSAGCQLSFHSVSYFQFYLLLTDHIRVRGFTEPLTFARRAPDRVYVCQYITWNYSLLLNFLLVWLSLGRGDR